LRDKGTYIGRSGGGRGEGDGGESVGAGEK
jgi:hypothetical protein